MQRSFLSSNYATIDLSYFFISLFGFVISLGKYKTILNYFLDSVYTPRFKQSFTQSFNQIFKKTFIQWLLVNKLLIYHMYQWNKSFLMVNQVPYKF
jgi:hypothetical protein